MNKLYALLSVRDGARDDILAQLAGDTRRCAESADGVEATLLASVPGDPILHLYRMRGYEVSLVLRAAGEASEAAELLLATLDGLGARLGDGIHADLSAAVFASENPVVPPPAQDTRYMSLMRRKLGTSHDEYTSYYRTEHARFGRECPGSTGYHQNYVDRRTSKQAADTLGFGIWDLDSVTEIFIPSAQTFDEATRNDPIREEAAIDEARFIDQPSMVGFCMSVAARLGNC
ncbi:MAG: hypothetical protein CL908_05620 [Deltaproteobacteria bacterium]|nr:hypothetical protein [Deltaproteobacteria bacterium]